MTSSGSRFRRIRPARFPPFTRSLEVVSNTFMGTLAGVYRLAEKEQGWIDLLLGVRGWYVGTDLDVGPGILPSGGRKIDHDEGWVDVIGGIRTRLHLSRSFHATVFTLAGGESSESVVDVAGQLGYAFTNKLSAMAGYRYIKVDYQKSDFEWNVEQKGPFLGLEYRFWQIHRPEKLSDYFTVFLFQPTYCLLQFLFCLCSLRKGPYSLYLICANEIQRLTVWTTSLLKIHKSDNSVLSHFFGVKLKKRAYRI